MVLFPKYQAFDDFSEKIFILLDLQSLNACQKVNKTWYDHVNDPKLWLKKCFMNKSRWLEEMSPKQTFQWTLANQQWNRLLKCLLQSESYNILQKDAIKCLKRLHCWLKYGKWKEKIPDIRELAPTSAAIDDGKLKLIKFILDHSKNIYQIENDKLEPVSDSVVIQIDRDIDTKKLNFWIMHAIFVAAAYNQYEILNYLIETYNIENPNKIREEYQNSPIVYAARYGNTKIVKLFMEYFCDSQELDKAAMVALKFRKYKTAWMINKTECFEDILLKIMHYFIIFPIIVLLITVGWLIYDNILT